MKRGGPASQDEPIWYAGLPMSLSSERLGAPTDNLNAKANSDSTQRKLTLSRFLPHSELT